ncbi:MAG TPA: hypothetical protein VFI72_16595 [Candidatus Angelobacter sp.]|nr:hypothetical protein [Candidatus Angelobacter sp.]
MLVDYSVELGRDDPIMEFPWSSSDGQLLYYDLKSDPSLIASIPEAKPFPDFQAFLLRVNATAQLLTSKCDVWSTQELKPEEELFGAQWKFGCYVDLLFSPELICSEGVLLPSDAERMRLAAHQQFAEAVCALLARVPEMPASIELVIRPCLFHGAAPEHGSHGFGITTYLFGFGQTQEAACRQWLIALKLLQNAILQILAKK